MCKEAGNTPTPVMKDPHDRSGHTETTTSFDDDDFPITKETFHASRLLRKDSIAVQKLHGPNDCEDHAKDPHLQDLLIPHHVVHMKRLDEDEPNLTAATTETDAESVSEESDADAAVTTPRRSCLRPETESYYDRPKTEKSKRKIHFGQVCVRDYDMILGDNPSVGYGPPVTIDWDYVEFNPIQMDEYEFHRPPRRSLREMGMNYYRRKHILELAGHTEEEFKVVKKEVNKWKTNRYLTRALVSSSIPFAKIEDSVESAVRKCRRLVKNDHWKSEKHLFVQWFFPIALEFWSFMFRNTAIVQLLFFWVDCNSDPPFSDRL